VSQARSPTRIGPEGVEWLLLAALAIAFTPAVIAMSEVWSRHDYYSHGYLVPFAALWAASAQRNRLPKLPITREPLRGGILLGLSLGLSLIGRLASIVSLEGLALVLSVASAVYITRGMAWLRSLGFSISYLIFMVPIPESLIIPLIAKLQLFVSAGAIQIAHALSLPVIRDGNVMHLESGESLFVAEACSGITSILTLVPLAVFLAYFTQQTFARRALLIASVFPIAMLENLTRVVVTIYVAHAYGSEVATGDLLHNWAGIATYVLGCVALLAVGSAMTRFIPVEKATT
jgi:exosortase